MIPPAVAPQPSDVSKYFPFLIGLAPLALFWQNTKSFLLKLISILWKKKHINSSFSIDFYKQLRGDSLVLDFNNYELQCLWLYHKKYNDSNTTLPVLFKMNRTELFLYKKFIPIVVSGDPGYNCLNISYLKFMFNFEDFIEKVCKSKWQEIADNAPKQRWAGFGIYERRGANTKILKAQQNNDNKFNTGNNQGLMGATLMPNNTVIFDVQTVFNNKIPQKMVATDYDEIKISNPNKLNNKYQFTQKGKLVLNVVEKWLGARNWYESKNIDYKRGVLLYSEPGQGKSALISEIAKNLNIPLFLFFLSDMNNDEFDNHLRELPSGEAIIVFEDIDSIWNGRENINKNSEYGSISFDYFINKLSGINCIKNKFIFITTNHLEKLDPALIRKGRMDEIIKLDALTTEEKYNMASKILENNKKLIEDVMVDSDKLSTADFENKCVEIALENYWKNNK